jgi:hypothetical protein
LTIAGASGPGKSYMAFLTRRLMEGIKGFLNPIYQAKVMQLSDVKLRKRAYLSYLFIFILLLFFLIKGYYSWCLASILLDGKSTSEG